MNYGQLVAAIQNYTQNSEPLFTGQINDFIRISEARVYRSVQMPVHYLHTASADSGDTGDVPADHLPDIILPVGFVEVTGVRFSSVDTDVDGPWSYLLRKGYDFLMESYPGAALARDGDADGTDYGVPRYYAIKDAGLDPTVQTLTIRVAPLPGEYDGDGKPTASTTFQFSVDGYGFNGDQGFEKSITVDPLNANETWLSVTFPDVLLNGALIDAFVFMKSDPGVIQHYEQLFHEGLATMASTVTGEQVDVSVGGPGSMPGGGAPGGIGV